MSGEAGTCFNMIKDILSVEACVLAPVSTVIEIYLGTHSFIGKLAQRFMHLAHGLCSPQSMMSRAFNTCATRGITCDAIKSASCRAAYWLH